MFKKIFLFALSLMLVLSAFGGCKSENPLKEGKDKTSKVTSSAEENEIKTPVDISLKRSDSVAFAGLISNNNAGKTDGTYYINYRKDDEEISEKLKEGEADVGVFPFDEAVKLCEKDDMMRIIAVNFESDIFAISKKEIVSLDDFKEAKILVLKESGIGDDFEFPKGAEVEITNDTDDTRLLAKTGLYDIVISGSDSAYYYKSEEMPTVSNIGALLGGLKSFALVSSYETILANTEGLKRLQKELLASAKTINAENLIDLYLITNTEKAEFLEENAKFDIKFFEELKKALGEEITPENENFFKWDI